MLENIMFKEMIEYVYEYKLTDQNSDIVESKKTWQSLVYCVIAQIDNFKVINIAKRCVSPKIAEFVGRCKGC